MTYGNACRMCYRLRKNVEMWKGQFGLWKEDEIGEGMCCIWRLWEG